MTLRLFNSLTGKKEELVPLAPPGVSMYVCGPTVYMESHVGHARVYVAFDVVARYLRHRGYQVRYVRNFTDVDDKIIRRANELKVPSTEVSEKYIAEFKQDMAALGVQSADVEPKVTEHIGEIVALIQKLVERGAAYLSQGDVYFAVRGFPGYGKLSKRNLDELEAGARVEPGEQKRDPLDFALWKAAKPGEPSWPSPFGPGRPGWHIECSAMAAKYLGETFDIHAGGKDLVFPHHENEIAQSEAASGKPFVRYWMHNGFVTIDEQKMSKSLGNFFTIRDVIGRFEPEALRYFLLGTHYRNPINFSDRALADAERRVDYIYETLLKVSERLQAKTPAGAGPLAQEERLAKLSPAFEEVMDDDFNTAGALAAWGDAFGLMNDLCDHPPPDKAVLARTLGRARDEALRMGAILGLAQQDPAAYLAHRRGKRAAARGIDRAQVEAFIGQREEARRAKDFARADRVREELRKMGVEIKDSPAGTTWKVLDAP